MKRKQLCSIITAALMATTLLMPYNVKQAVAKDETSVSAASVQGNGYTFDFQSTNDAKNSIQGNFTITNTSGSELDLSKVVMCYTYKNDNGQQQEFHCDYSGTIDSPNYQGFTDKVTGEITTEAGGKTVARIGFTSGTIAAGEKVQVCIRINSADWSDYADKGGIDVPKPKPVISPEKFDIYQGAASDTSVKIDDNNSGATLTSIKNGSKELVKGTDYKMSNDNVILTKDFLNSLTKNTTLTYTFSDGTVRTQNITVTPVPNMLDITVGDKECDAGDEIEVPVTLNNTPKYPALDYDFEFTYDKDMLEFEGVKGAGLSEGFDDSFVIKENNPGAARIQYIISDDEAQDIKTPGTLCVLKFKVKNNAKGESKVAIDSKTSNFSYVDEISGNGGSFTLKTTPGTIKVTPNIVKLDIAVGDVDCAQGEEIEVPVVLNNTPKYPALDYDFGFTYDKDMLEFEGVKGAGLSEGFDDSFIIKEDNPGAGRIQYIISDDDAQDIVTPGTLCVLKFKVKNNAKGESKVAIDADSNFSYVDEVSGEGGSFGLTLKAGTITVGVDNFLDIAVGNVKCNPGDEIEVPFTLNNAPKFPALDYDFAFTYDADRFEFEGAAGAGLSEGFDDSFVLKEDKPGSARIQYIISDDDEQDIKTAGTLGVLKFKVKDTAAEGDSKVVIDKESANFSYVDEVSGEGGNFAVKLTPGTITVGEDGPVVVKPSAKLESAEFNTKEPANIVADINEGSYEFTGVKETTAYKKAGNKVTIDQSYFAGLSDGDTTVTLQFALKGEIINIPLKVKVTTPDDPISPLSVETETVTAEAGTTVDIPIYLNIPDDKDVYGVKFNYADGKGTTFSKFTKGADWSGAYKGTDVAFNYFKSSKKGFVYAVFPKPATGIHVTGKVLFGTLKVTVDAGLASGTEVPVTFTDVQFSDANTKPVECSVNLGKVIVK